MLGRIIAEPGIIDIPLYVDDRGTVHCTFDNMYDFAIERTYIVNTRDRGRIRAWHGHKTGDTYMTVLSGTVKLLRKLYANYIFE